MNIFIEGLQGSGKSTLVTKLSKVLPEYGIFREGDLSPVELAWCSYMKEKEFHKVLQTYSHLEDEIRKWTKYELSEDGEDYYITAYTRILAEERRFYEEMESFEIYNGRIPFSEFRRIIFQRYRALDANKNVFECSLFQNTVETLMLFYQMEEKEILEFYREVYAALKEKNFLLLYLDTLNVRENIMQIRKERCDQQGNEMWYPLMLNYLKESPYGKAHHYEDFDDLVEHLERRRNLELCIIREVMDQDCISFIPSRNIQNH